MITYGENETVSTIPDSGRSQVGKQGESEGCEYSSDGPPDSYGQPQAALQELGIFLYVPSPADPW